MPLIFRATRADGSAPVISHTENDGLGVREKAMQAGGSEVGDVRQVEGLVLPGTGGMSVAPSKQALPPHLVPKRLRQSGYPAARRGDAKAEIFPWSLGAGEFADGPISTGLRLRVDPRDQDHGFVEPAEPVSIGRYCWAIEATRPDWIRESW